MNKKEFSVYLHQPHLIDRHAEIALQEVITDFPYFHAAHQLLLKAHQNNGSYHFDRQLPITSLLHGNRALLYAYLKDSLLREFKEVAKSELAITEEVLSAIHQAEVVINVAQEDELRKVEIGEIESILFQEGTPQKQDEQEDKEENLVSHLNATAILESLIVLENDDLPFQNYDEKYIHRKLDAIITEEDTTSAEGDTREIPIDDQPPITRQEEKVISDIEPHDFLSWLQTKKLNVTPVSKPADGDKVKLQLADHVIETEEATKRPFERKASKFNALIDKFIEISPSISKPQPTKFYSPAQKAKESVTESFDLATETLAKIYIKQNNYKKAILVYEKLSLLYPEKISYFAAQISELQTFLNR